MNGASVHTLTRAVAIKRSLGHGAASVRDVDASPSAAMELTLSEAGILSTFLEAILYGEQSCALVLRFFV